MNFKSRFLTLSMREQICLAIILLTILCVLIIISLTASFCYEILKVDYDQKKLYFYDRYKEYIEATFFFQNFCLLQYEEIVKRMQKQIYKFQQNLNNYNIISNFDLDTESELIVTLEPQNKNYSQQEYDINSNFLYYLCYYEYQEFCPFMKIYVDENYDSFTSVIMSHNIYDNFRIPGYDIPILKPPVIVNVNYSILFSFDASEINEQILNCFGNLSNYNIGDFTKYYKTKTEIMMSNIFRMFLYYFQDVLFLFDQMFNKTIQEINSLEEVSILNPSVLSTFYVFSKIASGYYSSVIFPNDKFSLISYDYPNDDFFYYECSLIDDFLYFLHNKLSSYLDIIFIPLHYQNNTIISPELCILLMMKINNYQIDENQLNDIYKKLIKGKTHIFDCFSNNNIFKEQIKIKEVFDLNCSHFLTVQNYKYTYPNYNVLKEFHSDYLLLDQVNFYLFASFKEPVICSKFVLQLNKNIFMLIIIIIFYTWIICLFINLIIFSKVIIQLTEPIKNLQEAIESSSIKDENDFKFEYDEFIDELFLTCKELLSGQIENNNNEKGLGQFNILSIPKDKINIDNNLYQKNLIINNDIINQLLSEQQNMMDFSKNIGVNEALDNISDNKFYENIKARNRDKKFIEDNLKMMKKKLKSHIKNYFKFQNIYIILLIN